MKKLKNIFYTLAISGLIETAIYPAKSNAASIFTNMDNPIYGTCFTATHEPASGTYTDSLTCMANNGITLFTNIAFIGATIAIVVAGIMYMTAVGDETRRGTAKKYLSYAIIGVATIAGAKIIISLASFLISYF